MMWGSCTNAAMHIKQTCALLFHPHIYFLNRLSCSGSYWVWGLLPVCYRGIFFCIRQINKTEKEEENTQLGFLFKHYILYNFNSRPHSVHSITKLSVAAAICNYMLRIFCKYWVKIKHHASLPSKYIKLSTRVQWFQETGCVCSSGHWSGYM